MATGRELTVGSCLNKTAVAAPRFQIGWKTWWLRCGLALTVLPVCARAEAPPPREFWDYLIEFGDASGDVFDPNDLAVTAHVQPKNAAKDNSAAAAKNNSAGGQPNATDSVEQSEVSPGVAPVAPGENNE